MSTGRSYGWPQARTQALHQYFDCHDRAFQGWCAGPSEADSLCVLRTAAKKYFQQRCRLKVPTLAHGAGNRPSNFYQLFDIRSARQRDQLLGSIASNWGRAASGSTEIGFSNRNWFR
jgi:hypothetical protein